MTNFANKKIKVCKYLKNPLSYLINTNTYELSVKNPRAQSRM